MKPRPLYVRAIVNGGRVACAMKQTANGEFLADFFSALDYYGQQTPTFPTLVLNSTTNLESAFTLLQSYQRVNAYLDNDTAGKAALERLSNTGLYVADRSMLYVEHKDFTAFWLESATLSGSG